MRILKFIVSGQTLKADPNCNFEGIVPGSEGHLQVEFAFSPDWNECVKVVGFYSTLGKEYPPQILKDGKSCIIPAEALKRRTIQLRVLGKGEAFTIKTNKVAFRQNGG